MPTKVILLNIDGLRRDPFYSLIDEKKLPNFCGIFSEGIRVERATSVFPSVTLTCQASLYTGCYPNRHYLLGNGWFDRYPKEPVYRIYTTLHTALHVFGFRLFGAPTILLPKRKDEPLANADLNPQVPTLYETLTRHHLRSAVVFNHISRGATVWRRPSRGDLLQFALCHEDYLEFHHFEKSTMRRAVQFIEGTRTLPDLLMIYFSGVDGFSHRHGANTQAGYLKKYLDPYFGKVVKALHNRREKSDFCFILSSDHGQAQVKNDNRYMILEPEFAEMLQRTGRAPFYPKGDIPMKKANTVIINQGGSMHLYVKNGKANNWHEPPDIENDLVPLAAGIEKIAAAPFKHILPNWLALTLIKDHKNKRYVVYRNGGTADAGDFFQKNDEKYPDAVARLRGYYSPKSADILFFCNYDDGFYFSDKLHGGQHGGLHREDSLVPFIVSGGGVKSSSVPRASIVDVTPTAAAILGLTTQEADGSPLPGTFRRST